MKRTMEKYLVVIEKAANNYSAYSPEVLGCVAAGDTIEETITQMRSALEVFLEETLEQGGVLPKPKGVQSFVDAQEMSEGEEFFITFLSIPLPSPAVSHP